MTESVHPDNVLSDLPVRPRVHQLAKHLGITSKELLAELAGLGHQLRSASSVVVAEAVQQLLARRVPEGVVEPEDIAVEPVPAKPVEPVLPAASEAGSEPLAEQPTPRQRRRRAASRPAGPPLEIAAPAEAPVTMAAAPVAAIPNLDETPIEEPAPRRRATRAAGGPTVIEPASAVETPSATADPETPELVPAEPESDRPAPRVRRRATRTARAAKVEEPAPETPTGSASADEVPEEDGIVAALRKAEEAARARRATIADPFAVTAE